MIQKAETPIVTLTLAPSLDSATVTPKIYPEGKLRCTAPVFEPGGGGINVARAIVHLGGKATALFPIGGPTGAHLAQLLEQEGITTETLETEDWTRQNLHVHTENTGEQYRFVMPGAKLTAAEFDALSVKVTQLPAGSILVVSGSLPPGTEVAALTGLLQKAKLAGLHCILDSSGDALAAGLKLGGLALVKPNKNELAQLVGHPLEKPGDVLDAARQIIRDGGAERVVVSLGPQGALAVDAGRWFQVIPPPEENEHRRRRGQHGRRDDAKTGSGCRPAGYCALRRGGRQRGDAQHRHPPVFTYRYPRYLRLPLPADPGSLVGRTSLTLRPAIASGRKFFLFPLRLFR